jgi:hypothetical protein
MKRSLFKLSSALAVLAATTACSVERTSTVLGPTGTSTSSKSSAPSMLGTWVVQGASAPAAVTSAVTVADF